MSSKERRAVQRKTLKYLLIFLFALIFIFSIGHIIKKRKASRFNGDSHKLLTHLQSNGFKDYSVVCDNTLTNNISDGGYLVAPGLDINPRGLARYREKGQQWSGILFFTPVKNAKMETIERNLNEWKEYGTHRDGFLFFGDPVLILKINSVVN